MADGGWKVGMFVDDATTPEQQEALAGIFSGNLGGPMAALAPLIGEFLGVERAPIVYRDDARRHSLTVGAAVDMTVEDVVHEGAPQGVKLTGVALPWGPDITVARAERARIEAFGMAWDNTGQNGHSAPIAWSA